MAEKKSFPRVKCIDDNGVESDCIELKCPNCDFNPIYVPLSELENSPLLFECPSCGPIYLHYKKQ